MKYIIIEDEDPAAIRLEKLVSEIEPNASMMTHLVSVKSSIEYLTRNPHPDLLFMDIQLSDGISFEIFNSVIPRCPVIFTTAYDQFAIQAFKVNSVDYLLKPVKRDELAAAIARFKERQPAPSYNQASLDNLVALIKNRSETQKRLLIRFGDTLKAVELKDVAYFYTENKINYLCTFDKKIYPIDQNLDQVESLVDPSVFFRINRQFVVNFNAINRMVTYSKSRVKLELVPPSEIDTVVSTERSPNFKIWLTGNSNT